jgi:hypothetical protein
LRLASFGWNANTNEDYLTISAYRHTSGGGWTNSSIRLAREVDNSVDVGGFIEFRATDFRVQGHWRPFVSGSYDCGSASNQWRYVYGELANFTRAIGQTAVAGYFENDAGATNDALNAVVRYNADCDSTPVDGHGGYLEFESRGADRARFNWVRAGSNTSYDAYWEVYDGSSMVEHLRMTWDDDVILHKHSGTDHQPQGGNNLIIDDNSTTGGGCYTLSVANGTNRFNETWNAYYDGSWKYVKSGDAAYRKFIEASATFACTWYWADNAGSAGDAITWDEILKLGETAITAYKNFVPNGTVDLGASGNPFDDLYVDKIKIVYTPSTLVPVDIECTNSTSTNSSVGAIVAQVGQATGTPSGDRYPTAITARVYGGGYTVGGNDIVALNARGYRSNVSTTSDELRGIECDVDDVGTGSCTVYGIDARTTQNNDTANCYAGYFNNVGGTTGHGVYATCTGASGSNFAILAGSGTKSWANPHPTDPTKEIIYATVEADRDTALLRGRGVLVNGRALILFPEHFAMTVSELPEEPVHVVVTPRDAASKGLAVVGSDHEKFEVVELAQGTGSYEFDYVVTGVRRGYEEREVITDNVDFVPGHGRLENFAGDVAEYYRRQSPGLKRIMMGSGLIDVDAKPEAGLFKAQGWKLGILTKPSRKREEERTQAMTETEAEG